jgi:hypothetical protein
MMNYYATPEATAEGMAWWLDRQRIPDDVLRSLDGMMLLPEECRDSVRNIVTREREALAALEIKLRTKIETPNHDEAPGRATILKGTDGALYDRYFRTQTAAYHKATKAIRELHEKPLEPAPPDGPDPDPHEGAPADPAAAEPTREPPVAAAASPEPMRAESSHIVPTSAAGPAAPAQGEPQGDAQSAGQAVAVERPGSCPAGADPSHPGLWEVVPPAAAGPVPARPEDPQPQGAASSAGRTVAVERRRSCPAGGEPSQPGLGDGFQASMARDGLEQRPLPEPGVPGDEAVPP